MDREISQSPPTQEQTKSLEKDNKISENKNGNIKTRDFDLER